MSTMLEAFQATFSMDVVRFEFDEFAKDGAFSDPDVIESLKDAGFDAIYLKPLSSEQKANVQVYISGVDDPKKGKRHMQNFYALWVAQCWVDPEGNKAGTAKQIGQLRSDVIDAIWEKVTEMNGLNEGAVEEAGKESNEMQD